MSGLLNSGLSGSNANITDSGRAFPSQSGSTSAVLNNSGNIQGLHGIHGNYNISNMPGSFASRNSSMIAGPPGIQQVTGGVSSGRFGMNNLSALSQLSLASSHGHSAVTDSGGSGALPNLGSSGRIGNPMANYVSGGNIARGLSSAGGTNLPGVPSRLTLSDPQVVSMLSGSYSGSVVPMSHSQFQGGSGPYTSLLLNDLSSHEDTAFDVNDFPQLSGRTASTGGSQGQMGFLRKQNVGFSQQNQEFSIHNEDFPALPGFKGGNLDFSMNIHSKEQLHSVSSLMHAQNMPMGRSGVNFGGANSSQYQQAQQHASSSSGSGLSYLPTNYQSYQDVHFHDHEARSIGPPVSGSGNSNLPNTIAGLGPYEQLPQQYQQFQKQSYFRMSAPFRDQDFKPPQATQAPTDNKYGMLGLLNIMKGNNPAMSSLARGIDLTSLGLNLNSSESIYKKFASPWSDEPLKGEPEYQIPDCYYAKLPPDLKPSDFSKFRPETLFYIFYSMPKDEAQLYAANELYNRNWFYHKEFRLWFARMKSVDPIVKQPTYEKGSYVCFDPNSFDTVRKDNFVLHYEMIERKPMINLQ